MDCGLGWKGTIGSLEGLKVMEMSFESWLDLSLIWSSVNYAFCNYQLGLILFDWATFL